MWTCFIQQDIVYTKMTISFPSGFTHILQATQLSSFLYSQSSYSIVHIIHKAAVSFCSYMKHESTALSYGYQDMP